MQTRLISDGLVGLRFGEIGYRYVLWVKRVFEFERGGRGGGGLVG